MKIKKSKQKSEEWGAVCCNCQAAESKGVSAIHLHQIKRLMSNEICFQQTAFHPSDLSLTTVTRPEQGSRPRLTRWLPKFTPLRQLAGSLRTHSPPDPHEWKIKQKFCFRDTSLPTMPLFYLKRGKKWQKYTSSLLLDPNILLKRFVKCY